MLVIRAADGALLQAALVAMKKLAGAESAPARWSVNVGADGVSATLDTDFRGAFADLPDGVTIGPAPLAFIDFMDLFTAAEQLAIVQSDDAQVRRFTLRASGAGEVDPANAETIAGVTCLAAAGLIAAPRVAEVLASRRPQA